MNPDRVLESFLEMVAIESPSWHEAPMAAYCAEKLAEMGFTVTFDASAAETGSDTGNLIAHLPGTVPGRIGFSAHLDTVKPCAGIEAVIEQRHICDDITCRMAEVVCSAGETILSADDKAGIAAIFEGLRSVLESGTPRPDITVLLTTCEEQSLLGAGALVDDALAWPENPPAATPEAERDGRFPLFVLDADGAPGTIIMGAPYHWTLRARIEGGVAVNIVPAVVTLMGECRSLYEDRVLAQRDAMTRALEEAAARFGGQVEVAWELDYPAVVHEPGDAIVAHLEVAAATCSLESRHATSGGGADANILGTKGADAITLGIGMTNFHSVDEYIEVADLQNMARYVEAIIAEYAG